MLHNWYKSLEKLEFYSIIIAAVTSCTIIKYIFDAKQLSIQSHLIARYYPLLFFITYVAAIYFSIQYNMHIANKEQPKYMDRWFAGLRFLILNCLIQVFVSLVMEFVFPNIKTEFILQQEALLNKHFFNKEMITSNMVAINKYYYLLKLSSFMFGMLVLGAILNTLICIVIKVYYKKIIKP